jgi:putative two-component system protein, hydrogenase maturation factor HypX/HoxX
MRILLIASAYNSMTQRAQVELAERGHEVSVELAVAGEVLRDGSGAMARTWSWRRC